MIENIKDYYSLNDIEKPFRNKFSNNRSDKFDIPKQDDNDLLFTLLFMLILFDDTCSSLDSSILNILFK